MKTTKLLSICMCCVMTVPAVWGQAASSQATTGILGYMDPNSGSFRPLPATAQEDAAAAAAIVFGGTITLTITITVKSTGLTTFTCIGSVSAVDGTTSPTVYSETNTVAATGTGATRSCKISIPYSWALTTQASDRMTTSYIVQGGASTTALPQRSSARNPLDVRVVPINGATTPLTAAVTL